MKSKFYCQKCQEIFETEGVKLEYKDPIYGPCWKRVADCPDCGSKCDEFRQKSSSKKSFDFDSYVSGLRNRGGGGCNPDSSCCR